MLNSPQKTAQTLEAIMRNGKSFDLESVCAEFEKWRAQRKGRERIPEKLWQLAITLLDSYPFHRVRKELNLNTKQLKMRMEASDKSIQHRTRVHKAIEQQSRPKQAFLELSASDLISASTMPLSNSSQPTNGSDQICRIVFERVDGSRLSMSLPVELNLIQSICNGFWKA